MSERRNDTPEPETESHRERERVPHGYYYDDGTGYEVYDPDQDDAQPNGESDESKTQITAVRRPA
ncbi:MAG: hypothetical protein H0W76_05755 [Pyrinomonadaceae bacterium]|nr:hypothetical protein [Pyrinomonadaceae bacterium]